MKNHNVLLVEYNKFEQLKNCGMEQDKNLKSVRLKIQQNAKENYLELQNQWDRERMQAFHDFLRWYKYNDVEPTIEAVKKLINFYQ